jgi:hypothetical protein
MKVDSMSFPESICTPSYKSICGQDDHHKLLLFSNPNVTHVNLTLFPSCPLFLSNKRDRMFSLSK